MFLRRPTILSLLLLLLLDLSVSRAVHAQERGLVLESYVGNRPRDADYLLAPVLDELKRIGYKDSSVAGTRIHSLHSLSSDDLSAKDIDAARRAIKDGAAAYQNVHFEGAIESTTRGVELLMSHPATLVRQAQVRDYLEEGLVQLALAHNRLGESEAFGAAMGEYIRTFPEREVSYKKYGKEGTTLYAKISSTMNEQSKGELQIVAEPGSMVFVNEKHAGFGSLNLQLFPGRYRVFTMNGAQAGKSGRIHLIDVEASRKQTLVLDTVVDRSLRTEGMVGFVFASEDERNDNEQRVALDLGKALGAENIILVGIHKFKGEDSVVASSVSIITGEAGPSARVPLPKNGAPSAEQLRELAKFVGGVGPASDDIEVLTASPMIVEHDDVPGGRSASAAIDVHAEASASSGISSAWRYTSWGVGAIGIGVGAYLLAIDGTGSCQLQPGQVLCPENFETRTPGIALIASGTTLGLLGFYLWTFEEDDRETRLSVVPRLDGGMSASLSGRF